ncbi:hypothetical protein LINPERPRIM_LOCUS38097, partial [Linum perenne]
MTETDDWEAATRMKIKAFGQRWGELRGEEDEEGRKVAAAAWPKPEEEGEGPRILVHVFLLALLPLLGCLFYRE